MTTPPPENPAPASLDKVPPMPGVALELLRSLADEDLNTADLARKIGCDPVLTARVLKIVNSPFYGVAGRIASLQEAVMVLGFSNVRNLALAAAVCDGLPQQGAGKADPRRLWRHSFSCALCAQALARPARIDAEAAFTAGLLHDIGRLALLNTDRQRFLAVLEAREQYGSLVAAESAILGFTHAEYGAGLLARWRLPPALVRAVAGHHRPDREPCDPLTDLIHIADIMAHALNNNALETLIVEGAPNNAVLRLGLTRLQCSEALADVPRQLEALSTVLN